VSKNPTRRRFTLQPPRQCCRSFREAIDMRDRRDESRARPGTS
jgi:hypothetical protein